MNILAYLCSFTAIEWYWLEQGASLINPVSTQVILPLGNDLFLLSAAILASQLINSNSRQSHFKAKFKQQRAETLLGQTLPTALVNKLTTQASENLFTKPFDNKFACVLFADMQNYTQLCSSTNNEQLMELLSEFYTRMDEISRRWGLEKIKTNGDQYVATCGLLVEHTTPALPSCQAALEMLSLTKLLSSHYAIKLRLRIGIASGDVSSGFIGGHSARFDIWGSTVNLASRLESHGINDKVQVCQTTHHQCKHRLNFIPRGKIKLKGIGTLDAFILQAD
jgi:guanylate cyclase